MFGKVRHYFTPYFPCILPIILSCLLFHFVVSLHVYTCTRPLNDLQRHYVITHRYFNRRIVTSDSRSADMLSTDSILLNRTCCVPGSRCDISPDLLNKLKSFNILSDCCHGHELHSHPANKPTKVGRSRVRWRKRGKRAGKQRIRTIITPNLSRRTTKVNNSDATNLVRVPLNPRSKRNAPKTKLATWNARSIKNKSASLCQYIISNHLDILAITETWLTGTDKDNVPIADIQRTLPNYELYHIHRQHCRGGGVGVIVRNGLKVSFNTTLDFQSFEYGYAYLIRQHCFPSCDHLPTQAK